MRRFLGIAVGILLTLSAATLAVGAEKKMEAEKETSITAKLKTTATKLKATYQTYEKQYQQIMNMYNFGKNQYTDILNTINSFKNSHGTFGKLNSVLGILAKFGVIDQQSYSALSTIVSDVQKLLGLGISNWPPRFYIGLPRQIISLGKQAYAIYNDITKQVANIDGVNVNLPGYYVYQACLKGILPPKACQNVENPVVFVGKHSAGVVSEKTSSQIAKEISQNVETTAATSDVDQSNVGPKDEAKLDVLFNQRNVLMNGALLSHSNVPVGKEYADKVPAAVKPYYNFLAYQELMKDAYVKSLQRRLKIHYEKLIALKHLVEQVCDTKVNTPPPVCKGGGILGTINGLTGGLGGIVNLGALQNITGNLQNLQNLTNLTGEIQNNLHNITGQLQNLTNIPNVIKQKIPKLESNSYLMETRCCCAPCTPAVHAAEAHIQARLTAMETAIITSIQTATQQIIQTIQTEQCLTRTRLKMEFDLLRGQQKALMCAYLRIQLEDLMLKIDQLEAQVANTAATMTLIQNSNYNVYQQQKKKIEEMGYELLEGNSSTAK